METFLMYFLFAVGIVLIVKGGDWFVDGAVWIAEVTKIPKFIFGTYQYKNKIRKEEKKNAC